MGEDFLICKVCCDATSDYRCYGRCYECSGAVCSSSCLEGCLKIDGKYYCVDCICIDDIKEWLNDGKTTIENIKDVYNTKIQNCSTKIKNITSHMNTYERELREIKEETK